MDNNQPATTKSRKNKPNLTQAEKRLVFNFYTFLTSLKNDIQQNVDKKVMLEKYGNVMYTVSDICGMAKSTIAKVIKDTKEGNNEERNLQRDSQVVRKVKYECTDEIIGQIRHVVLDFYVKKTYPTLENILKECLLLPHFPKISQTTLWRWLTKKCRFSYIKLGKKPVFLERSDIKAQRKFYLKTIKAYRENNYSIVYTDETWTSPELAPSRCWQLKLKGNELKEFLAYTENKVLQSVDGYTGGFMVKGGQGRIIINHAGNEMGFIKGEGISDIFISKKDSADYHTSMNAEHFMDWFQKLVECVKDKTVIVLDQAPYHKKRVPTTVMPTKSTKKDAIIKSLEFRGVAVPTNVISFQKMTKNQLLDLSKKHPIALKYEVELIAEQSGKDVQVLWLPVAHCELNPIELIWSIVKRDVAKKNSIGGTRNVYLLSIDAVDSVTPEQWANCVQHAIKVEDDMIQRDRDIDGNLDLENQEIELNISSDYDADLSSDRSFEL